MAEKLYQNEEWLRGQYIENELTLDQVSKLAGCCLSTVYLYLKQFEIPVRSKSEAISKAHSRPEYKKKRSEIQNRRYKDPEYRKMISSVLHKCNTDPKIVKRRAETLKKTLATPEVYAKRVEMLDQMRNDPEIQAKRIESVKAFYADPVNHDKLMERMAKTVHSAESKRKHAELIPRGKDHYNWKGGKSFEPYTYKFNERRREFVRERDGRSCAVCGVVENGLRLDVHHINYNKRDSSSNNLISLCHVCHPKTNYNRYYWFAMFVNHWITSDICFYTFL